MIQRDPAAAQALIYVHPEPVPSGSAVLVGQGDSLVLLFDGEPREVKIAGTHHAYSPSYATVRAVFVQTGPNIIRSGGAITVKDAPSGATEQIKYTAELQVQVSDPKRLCAVIGNADAFSMPQQLQALLTQKATPVLRTEVARACLGKALAVVLADPATAHGVSSRVQQQLHQEGLGVEGVQVLGVAVRLIGDVAASSHAASAPSTIAVGTRVFAYWTDGNWYPAVVRAAKDGHYEVDWEGNPHTAWLPATHVRPA